MTIATKRYSIRLVASISSFIRGSMKLLRCISLMSGLLLLVSLFACSSDGATNALKSGAGGGRSNVPSDNGSTSNPKPSPRSPPAGSSDAGPISDDAASNADAGVVQSNARDASGDAMDGAAPNDAGADSAAQDAGTEDE
jgi:hypothetical protein